MFLDTVRIPGLMPARSWIRSTLLLLLVRRRLPELDLVLVGIHDPRELAVLVRVGPLNDGYASGAQLLQNPVEVVDAVIDHERRLAGTEPLAVLPRDMPHRLAAVPGLVVRPS